MENQHKIIIKSVNTIMLFIVLTSLIAVSCTKEPNISYPDSTDLPENLQLVVREARKGNTQAQFRIGETYARGELAQKDINKAIFWFEQAALNGDKDAAYNAGFLYETESDDIEKYTKAFSWYKVAAEKHGMADAMGRIANMYINNQLQDTDSKNAFYWSEKAAILNDPYSQYNLGSMYYTGRGVEKNLKLSFEWFEKAARNNVTNAMYFLGRDYREGNFVEKDISKAYVWLKLSLLNSRFDSDEKIMKKIESEVKYLESKLTKEELRKAQIEIDRYPNSFQ